MRNCVIYLVNSDQGVYPITPNPPTPACSACVHLWYNVQSPLFHDLVARVMLGEVQ